MITQTLDFMRDAAVTEPAQTLNVMALLESLQHDYHDAGQEFKIRGGVARPVSGRPRALRRCLSNLLDNAIRYGRRASIEVEERSRELAIRVLDEGPGIPEAELERAFEPFVCAHDAHVIPHEPANLIPVVRDDDEFIGNGGVAGLPVGNGNIYDFRFTICDFMCSAMRADECF